ncbi:MAG: amidohydrolase family protein [Selenomonadaceae bacterium]|nr:amidohydrolase family protein [Selenomonadaceae bacterium]
MIIDMHTHIFPEKISGTVIEKLSRVSRTPAFTDGTLSGLKKSMDAAQINFSGVLPVATNTSQVEKINSSSAALNEKFFGEGIISFGCMHPDFTNYREELSRVKNHGLKGIKIHPVYQDVNLDDVKFLRILDRAAELNLIVVTHAGLDIGFPGVVRCSPQMTRRVVEAVGDFKFVLAHMGGWKNWDDVLKILGDTKIFIDTSFSTGKIIPRNDFHWEEDDLKLLTPAQFMEFVKIFGADKILFGTDSPWTSATPSIDFIKNLPLAAEDKDKILGLNAQKLLEL